MQVRQQPALSLASATSDSLQPYPPIQPLQLHPRPALATGLRSDPDPVLIVPQPQERGVELERPGDKRLWVGPTPEGGGGGGKSPRTVRPAPRKRQHDAHCRRQLAWQSEGGCH